jgi:hypothetical protein
MSGLTTIQDSLNSLSPERIEILESIYNKGMIDGIELSKEDILIEMNEVTPLAPHWGDWEYEGVDKHPDTIQNHHKYRAIIWDIPWGVSWEDVCNEMHSDVPENIDGEDIDKSLSGCWNQGPGINMWTIAFSYGWGLSLGFGSWEYEGQHPHPDDLELHHKFRAVIHGIPAGHSWEEACEMMKEHVPDTIGGEEIDKSLSGCWNQGPGIAMWMIVYSKGWGQLAFTFGDWEYEGIHDHPDDDLNHHKYRAVIWGIPPGWSWEGICEKLKDHVPEVIDSEDIDKSLSSCWNQGPGINMWMIVYSKGWSKDGGVIIPPKEPRPEPTPREPIELPKLPISLFQVNLAIIVLLLTFDKEDPEDREWIKYGLVGIGVYGMYSLI